MLGWVFCGKTIAVIGDDIRRAQTGALQHRLERQQTGGGARESDLGCRSQASSMQFWYEEETG